MYVPTTSYFISTKGQIISKANHTVFIWTKKRTKYFFYFCPKIDSRFVGSSPTQESILLLQFVVLNPFFNSNRKVMKISSNQPYFCDMWDIKFQKKTYFLEWGSNPRSNIHIFRAELEKFWVRFLVQMKAVEFAFEINWPLTI